MIPRNLIVAALISQTATADSDWPTYRHDNRRSGASDSELTLPLKAAWTHQAGTPRQAWSGPAKWDAYSGNAGLQSMRNFDPCHFTTIAGDRVYFGSSSDDAAHCLDLATGEPVWTHFTNGPVRLPPTISDDLAWFGSDDGHVYCVDASTGSLKWEMRAAPEDRLIASNGKLISPWPVRTGILVNNGKAYFAASLVPWEKSYLFCVDAESGSHEGKGLFATEHREVTLQGAMLSSGEKFFIPQGRAAPLAFNHSDGSGAGTIGHAGGVTCVLTEDNQLIAGPRNQKAADDQVKLTDLASGKPTATFNRTNRATVHGSIAYLHNGSHLVALDLSKPDAERELWRVSQPIPAELIVAGAHLILGHAGFIEILDIMDGTTLTKHDVDGVAHGLSVAGGSLLVSTNRGSIHAFAP